MIRLSSYLSIGPALLLTDFVHQIEVKSSWQMLTDTATIQLPRNRAFRSRSTGVRTVQALPDMIKVGDAITVEYGYEGRLREEFSGYVAAIKPGNPFTLECQDEMWALKQQTMSGAWHSTTLKALLEFVRDHSPTHFPIDCPDVTLGKYRVSNATGAQVLEALKSQYGIHCFFRRGVLTAFDVYKAASTAPVHQYDVGRNIISHTLEYVTADTTTLRFRGTSRQANGKMLTVDEGTGGELRTIVAPPGLTSGQLKTFIQAEIKRLKFDGYRGTLTGFGVPLCEHGDIVAIADSDYADHNGRYAVDEVTKSFGVGGSRRTIKLGPKA